MTALLVAVALVGPAPTPTPHDGNTATPHRHHRCVHECRARVRCERGRVGSCIHRAAIRYRVGWSMLRRKAWCESRLRPWAYNAGSGASGLFQFLPSTWRTTPYGRRSIWSAKWSALAAGWMHAHGRGGEGSCR